MGEGHLSSTVFREGAIGGDGSVHLEAGPRRAVRARMSLDQHYVTSLFRRKLGEFEVDLREADGIFAQLGERFSALDLDAVVTRARRSATAPPERILEAIWALVSANYQLRLPPGSRIGELILYPQSAYEARGIEDLRLVRFVDDDGHHRYYGTYTAFDGARILPMLVETRDFKTVDVHTLNGACARGKGLALFPRKIGGRFVMCSRIDGRNLFLMTSEEASFWQTADLLAEPRSPWEYRLIGNCGSPIETPEGWLLMTHGVGPMRRYAIGAMLLDLKDPRIIRGRLREPLLEPPDTEPGGYVPNVVYSCGTLLHAGRLYIPYAVADETTVMVRVDLAELLRLILSDGA